MRCNVCEVHRHHATGAEFAFDGVAAREGRVEAVDDGGQARVRTKVIPQLEADDGRTFGEAVGNMREKRRHGPSEHEAGLRGDTVDAVSVGASRSL